MALRLKKIREPYWLEQGPFMALFGIRIKVKPQDGAIQTLMQSSASKELRELREAIKTVTSQGGSASDMPDLEDDVTRDAFMRHLMHKHAARHAIVEWEGVLLEDDTPAPINDETIDDLINTPNFAQEFIAQYNAPIMELRVEQNFSLPAPNGTMEAGESIVPDAETLASPVPGENQEPAASSART